MKVLNELMEAMNSFVYGFPDQGGSNILEMDPEKYDREFYDFYYLQTPSELEDSKCGVCWDQVEFERDFLEQRGILSQSYFICTYDGDNLPSHTFLVIEDCNKFYWFEHSWGVYRGIHEYSSLKELLLDVKQRFVDSYETIQDAYTFVYLYDKPPSHIGCSSFYKYAEKGQLMKLNAPFYFYHLVDKNADLEKGLYSLQYMYHHQLFNLFDKHAEKYKKRIVSYFHILKYQGRSEDSLSREEILDALSIFRGKFGPSYLYFFRYPPIKALGKRMAEVLEGKEVYKININDEEVQRNIKDIFYGYEESHSDCPLLDRAYYENVSEEEYFSKYDDCLEMNFSTLNHIAIAFLDDFCPIEFLEQEKEC